MTTWLLLSIIITSVLILFLLLYLFIFQNNKTKKLDNFSGPEEGPSSGPSLDKLPIYIEIDNFLTNDECDSLIKQAKNVLVRSPVMSVKNGKYENTIDNVRTSMQTFLKNDKNDAIVTKIENALNSAPIKAQLNLQPVNKKQFENIQVVRYQPSQEYREHYDICHPTQAPSEHLEACKAEFKQYNCVRYLTVLFYLNDDYKGGQTKFTNLNQIVTPKKGKALIFVNCAPNDTTQETGLCDLLPNSQHAGLPVKEGEKWIANVWIRCKNIK